MKHHRTPPLLKLCLPDSYLVDTSAWINIDLRSDCADVWTAVTALIHEGRLFTCAQVLSELQNNPIYIPRIKPYERELQVGDRGSDDIPYLQRVGAITHDFPRMSKARGSKTPADPYIVALAELESYVVVADESRKHPSSKIPGVCDKLGIRCITLDKFVAEVK